MGVTIHFQGQLKSNDSFAEVVLLAKDFAELNEMPYTLFEEEDKLLERVKDEKDWDYQGPTKGIRIQPSANSEPLMLEFDSDHIIQEYCKTQYTTIDTHIKIVELLHQIAPLFKTLVIDDEGEYWETADISILQEHIDNCFSAIEEAKKENNNLKGPFRQSDGRITDLMG